MFKNLTTALRLIKVGLPKTLNSVKFIEKGLSTDRIFTGSRTTVFVDAKLYFGLNENLSRIVTLCNDLIVASPQRRHCVVVFCYWLLARGICALL